MHDWYQVENAIREAKNILILTHIHADGDAIGSAFALAYYLCSGNRHIYIVSEETPPADLSFIYDTELPDNILFSVINDNRASDGDIPVCDAAFAIDTGDVKRLGSSSIFFSAEHKIRIDHHISYDTFADITVCDTSWAATAEGIWEFILCSFHAGGGTDIKNIGYYKKIAEAIYAGILTDTGCFAYSNVTAATHRIAAELIETAGNMSWQYSAIYENISKAEIALRKLAYDKIEYYADGRIAFLVITEDDMAETGADDDQIQSFAPFLRCIENVSVGILAKPNPPGGYRLSMRSDETCDVASVAAVFGGGGHKRAAGLTYKDDDESFENFKKRVIGETIKWMA